MQQEALTLSVQELNNYVSALLTTDPTLCDVRVRGEISGFKRHSSGHLYFSLKDAGAVVRCVMFRQYAQQLAFRPEDGQQVVVTGSASLYVRDGSFQLYVREMESMGAGELYRRFLVLKDTLEAEGLFDPAHKKTIPFLPRCVGVVTSGTGAALQDVMQIVGRRFPNMHLCLCPVRVQGDGAAEEIAAGIRAMNREQAADVLIVGRGGGSMEDLWAFNEPIVARAIYESEIPVISAVGHETDFTIADFAADLRAPTPSAAAELAVPEFAALEATLKDGAARLSRVLGNDLERRRNRLQLLRRSAGFMQTELRLANERQRLDDAKESLVRIMTEQEKERRHAIEHAKVRLAALSPEAVLRRGFAVVRKESGAVVSKAQGVRPSERVEIRFADGAAAAEILTVSGGK